MLSRFYRVRRIFSLLWNIREVFWCLDIASRIIGSQMKKSKDKDGIYEIKTEDRTDLYRYLAFASRTRGGDHEDGRFLPHRVPKGWDWSRCKW